MKFAFSFLLISFCLLVSGQADTAFIYTYGGGGDDEGKDIIETTDGGYLIVGSTSSFGNGNSDLYLVKLDSSFQVLWTKAYGGPQIERGEAVLPASDGGYFAIGYTNSFGMGGYDVYLLKLDANGEKEWEDYYGGANWDFAYDAAVTPSGDLIIVGESYSFNGGDAQAYVLKVDAFGGLIWEKDFGGYGDDLARAVCSTSDSNFVFTGETSKLSDDGNADVWLLKFNNKGEALWEKGFGDSPNNRGNNLIETNDSGIVVVGFTTAENGDKDLFLVKTTSNGELVWTRIHGRSNALDDEGFDVRETIEGRLVICGLTLNYGSGQEDMYTLQTSSSGNWQTAPSYGGSRTDIAYRTIKTKKKMDLFLGKSNSYTLGYYDVAIVLADTVDGNKVLEHTSFSDSSLFVNPTKIRESSVSLPLYTPGKSSITFNHTTPEFVLLYALSGELLEEIRAFQKVPLNLEKYKSQMIIIEYLSSQGFQRLKYIPR